MSRLSPSSKWLPGVLEDMEVPDTPACGVRRSILVPRMFGENFMQIGAKKGVKTLPVLQVASWSLGGRMVDPGVMDMKCITFPYVDNMILTHFLMNLEYKKALKMYITTLRNRPKLGSF